MSESSHPASPDEIRAQLARVVSSGVLAGSDQLKRLLRLVVERTLNSQGETLKEYNLGLEVFGRPPDYDPKSDPIVRVQARRLRAKLEEYYAGEGASDPVSITIPKGAYIPAFAVRAAAIPASPVTSAASRHTRLWLTVALVASLLVAFAVVWVRQPGAAAADSNRSLAVLPLKMFTEGGARSHVAGEVGEVLTTELAKRPELRVLSRTTASRYEGSASSLPDIARELGVRWVVEGGVGMEGNHAYIKLRVVDALSDRKVWADVVDCDLDQFVATNARAAKSIGDAVIAKLRPPGS